MKTVVCELCRARIAAVGLVLLVALAGCTLFPDDPIPQSHLPQNPVVLLYGIDAEGAPEWFKRDDSGQIEAFVPLAKARDAITRATGSEAVSKYSAGKLAKARAALASAQNTWQSIASDPQGHHQKLLLVAHKAHQAKRYAQIAYGIGMRETGLRQLLSRRTTPQKQTGNDNAPRGKSGAAGAKKQTQHHRANTKPKSGTTTKSHTESMVAQPESTEKNAPWLGRQLIPGTLGEVQFVQGSTKLTNNSTQTVKNAAWFLHAHAQYGLALVVAGGGSATATADNQALALRRAKALQQALVNAGVNGDRVFVERHGPGDKAAHASASVVAIVVPRRR